MNLAELSVKIDVDDTKATSTLNNFSKKMSDIGNKMTNVGSKMTLALTAPLLLAGKQMFSAAADFDESMNKVDVAFGDSAGAVKEFAKTTIDQFGMAEGTALEMAGLFGDMGTAMGLTTDEASKMAMGLTGLAGDLSSFKNVRLDVAQTALAAIFTGETESLKKMGIIMTDATLKEYALAQGITKSYSEMTQAEKVQLRYAFVTNASSNAVGDFARTSDSSANVTKKFGETIKETSVALGQALLPIITPIIEKATEWVQWFGNLDDNTKGIIVTVGIFVASLGPVVTLIGTVIKAVQMLSAAFTFLSANPIGAAIAAIAALVIVVVYFWTHMEETKARLLEIWEAIKNAFVGAWNGIKKVFSDIYNGIKEFIDTKIIQPFKNINLFEIGVNLLKGLWNGVSSWASNLYSNIKTIASNVVSKISSFFGIRSPSTVLFGIGRNLSIGFANGIVDPLGMVDVAVDKLTDINLDRKLNVSNRLETAPVASSNQTGYNDQQTMLLSNMVDILKDIADKDTSIVVDDREIARAAKTGNIKLGYNIK